MGPVANTIIYGVLLIGVILLLRQAINRRNTGKKLDIRIDIIAYSIMAVGLAFLFVTCIFELVTGHPIFY